LFIIEISPLLVKRIPIFLFMIPWPGCPHILRPVRI